MVIYCIIINLLYIFKTIPNHQKVLNLFDHKQCTSFVLFQFMCSFGEENENNNHKHMITFTLKKYIYLTVIINYNEKLPKIKQLYSVEIFVNYRYVKTENTKKNGESLVHCNPYQ